MQAASRPYHSPRRAQQAQQTRARILAAAAERFQTRGWAGTTLAGVAADAGVSLPTVEITFGTKAALLKAAIDVITAGDAEPVAMLDRPWADLARKAPSATQFLDVFSTTLAEGAARAARLVAVAFEAAPTSPDLADVAATLATQRETMATWLVDGLLERSALRAGVTHQWAVDTAWALMDPVLFVRLVHGRGWSTDRYAALFSDSIARLVLP